DAFALRLHERRARVLRIAPRLLQVEQADRAVLPLRGRRLEELPIAFLGGPRVGEAPSGGIQAHERLLDLAHRVERTRTPVGLCDLQPRACGFGGARA